MEGASGASGRILRVRLVYIGGSSSIYRIALAALVAAFVVSGAAQARPGCHSRACSERVARKHCSQRHVVPCIQRAALHYRVSFSLLRARAWCESRLNPYARGGPNLGLFQFNWPGTWGSTPYAARSPFSAKWNSLAAGWMEAHQRGGEWSCYPG